MTELELLRCFRRNANGTWTALQPITIGGITIGPGVSFAAGVGFGGVDLAVELNILSLKHPWAVLA